MGLVIAVCVGFVLGAALTGLITWLSGRRLARTLATDNAAQQQAELETLLEQIRTHFAALSREALSANTDDFLKLAKSRLDQQTAGHSETLDAKKKLIDQQLEALAKRLGEMTQLMQSQETQRRETHGALRSQLEQAAQVTQRLQGTTEQLRQALANPQRRGAWGERIAEDVLKLAGLVEGVSYQRQTQLAGGNRPDFTFPLPNGRVVNMDVKFPVANYLRSLETDDADQRQRLTRDFLRDVRQRIKEVTTRDYIDPAAGTVDYVLVFIPNEQIYTLIHAEDPSVLDEALRQKVVLCAPLTLYAMLAVMRQAADNFRLQQASQEILELLAEFQKQWDKYVDVSDRLGKRLEDAVKAYQELTGTRTRQLERQLDRIQTLRDTPRSEALVAGREQE